MYYCMGSHCVVRSVLELMTAPHQSPKCCDARYVPSQLVQSQSSILLRLSLFAKGTSILIYIHFYTMVTYMILIYKYSFIHRY